MLIDTNSRVMTAEEVYARQKWQEMIEKDYRTPERLELRRRQFEQKLKELEYTWNRRFSTLECAHSSYQTQTPRRKHRAWFFADKARQLKRLNYRLAKKLARRAEKDALRSGLQKVLDLPDSGLPSDTVVVGSAVSGH